MKKLVTGVLCLVLVLLVACREENETIDLIEGVYEADLEDAQFEEGIEQVSSSASILMDFYAADVCSSVCVEEQWVLVEFHGGLSVDGVPILGEVELWGPEEDIIEGVTIDDRDLTCSPCKLFGRNRDLFGTFFNNFKSLEIDSPGIGKIPLQLQPQ